MRPRDSDPPAVSVVVPARNPGHRLRDLLEALDGQTIEPARFEVIVVDDGSTDDAFASLPARPWLRILRQEPSTSYAARNRGVAAARGEVLAFTDVDCVPDSRWLTEGLGALNGSAIVAGRIGVPTPARPTVWSYVEADTWRDQEAALRRSTAETANLFVRREWFDRVGGFDPDLPSGGDYDFVRRIVSAGGGASYCEDALVLHEPRPSGVQYLRTVWRRHRWHGYREATLGRRPYGLRLRSYLPILPTVRARRRSGAPLRVRPRAFTVEARPPRLRQHVAAAVILYLVLPWWRSAAELVGWLDARRRT